jgi:hypothetical protein
LGGIGDVFADEIKFGTIDLMKTLNQAVLGTGDGTAEDAALGFEGMIKTSGNLYGRNVAGTGYTTLAAAGVDAMSSASITLKKMREMIRGSVTNGARVQDLAFIGPHLQVDFIKALIQDMQRIVPTSARVGFTGNIEFDGVPVFPEVDCNTDDLFLIDIANTKIGIKLPPVFEEYGRDSDARRGHIKTYWNMFCTHPNHNYWINGLATS